MNLVRAIATVGGLTLLSRVTGFARDILIAGLLGAGGVADAFFVAFKFPNLFRRLFAEGAFTAAFVPLFSRHLEGEERARARAEARAFAERAMSLLGVVLLALVALMEAIMPWAIHLFAPGFSAVPGKLELAAELSRITFPYLLFISLVSLQSGVLNGLGRFAAAAAAPILLNLTLIAFLVAHNTLPEPPFSGSGHALAWAVSAAGVIQFVWLWVNCARAGMTLRPRLPRLTPEVKTLARRIVPGAIGAGVYQINLLVDTILASLVAPGAVSYLYYADRVTQLPLGVVGVAVGTALLPLLSRQLKAGRDAAAMGSMNRALEVALLFTVPAAVALMVLAGPLIGVLFERGAFDAEARQATAGALAAFAVGLPAYVLIKVLAPGFFAREDTRTPVKVAAVALLINVVLNLSFMWWLGHLGIALATALSAWVNALSLALLLRRRDSLVIDDRLAFRLPRIIAAAGFMGGGLGLGVHGLAPWLAADAGASAQALALSALVLGGGALFGLLAWALRALRPADLLLLRRPPSDLPAS
ncbi:murein biosynthesis integral membrane protein MurJ [Roseospirillum parvum]|uniref:Probable lipid II flippase MurJ n=1 Tax=Roseospirillum parvum TaxID=83401 RepID=A0A1G7Z7R0_9PROT|nr:murein biosynthesis integral membrane protein MurJ [Roseospirillum parvum]SDH04546.1 putative peptidoglycan lipid II flippase [Roseospirillum parvum]